VLLAYSDTGHHLSPYDLGNHMPRTEDDSTLLGYRERWPCISRMWTQFLYLIAGVLVGSVITCGVVVFSVRWPLICEVNGMLFWTALGAVGSAAAAIGAVYAGSTAIRTARIGQQEARAKDRAQAVTSAANILIELQRVEGPLRALEIFYSGTELSQPDVNVLAFFAIHMDIDEPVETLARGHELLPLRLDRVALEAAVSIAGLREKIKAVQLLNTSTAEDFRSSQMDRQIMERLRDKVQADLGLAASKAWHATARAVSLIGKAIGSSQAD